MRVTLSRVTNILLEQSQRVELLKDPYDLVLKYLCERVNILLEQ